MKDNPAQFAPYHYDADAQQASPSLVSALTHKTLPSLTGRLDRIKKVFEVLEFDQPHMDWRGLISAAREDLAHVVELKVTHEGATDTIRQFLNKWSRYEATHEDAAKARRAINQIRPIDPKADANKIESLRRLDQYRDSVLLEGRQVDASFIESIIKALS